MKRKSALCEGVQGCAVAQCVMKATVPSATPSGPACDCTNIGCLYGNSCIIYTYKSEHIGHVK